MPPNTNTRFCSISTFLLEAFPVNKNNEITITYYEPITKFYVDG